MACFGLFGSRENDNKFKNLYFILDNEPRIIKDLIEVSDGILLSMNPQRMIQNALECFSETEECLFNYRRALELTKNSIIKEYCKIRIKEALDTRTVIAPYLPKTSIDELLNNLNLK